MADDGFSPEDRIGAVELDQACFGRTTPDVEHERELAIFDLLEHSRFSPHRGAGTQSGQGFPPGPYHLSLSINENRLTFDIRDGARNPLVVHALSLTPFRRHIRDYFAICNNYYRAIKASTPQQIEAFDMARRVMHNEAADLLISRLEGKISLDHDTARRLFTLIGVLQWRGPQSVS